MKLLTKIGACLAMTMGLATFANPASAQETACITSTAEAMLVPTSEIVVTATGPVDPESGVQTLSMRNQRTGMTAECRYNQIDQQVMAVEIMDVGINPPPSEPISQEAACITSTAEAMLVPTSEIVVTGTGPVNPESGVVTLSMRNQRTGMTAECRYNQIDQQVMSVELMDAGINPPPSGTVPTQGTFAGLGTASGSIFGQLQQVDASLNFNQSDNFNFWLAVLPGNGDQVQYLGVITERMSLGRNDFRLETQVQSFASSASGLQLVNTTGSCRIEVFDARVASALCNVTAPNGNTQFTGISPF